METLRNSLPKIALFDDDEANLRLYSNFFKNHFKVIAIQNPFLFEQSLEDDVAAILIDVLMPIKDGISLSEELKSHHQYNGCPVIFISASGSEQVLKNALSSGGQDFLSRNMSREEMILRVRNKIEYFKSNRNVYILGNIKLHVDELKAYHLGKVLDLTLTETRLLKFLINAYPETHCRQKINEFIWPGQVVMPTTLNTHLSNLRNKFSLWEYEILNTKGVGIQLLRK